jgi:hypothetical protein
MNHGADTLCSKERKKCIDLYLWYYCTPSFHFSLAKVKEPGRVWSEARERRKDKTLCPVDDDDAMLVTETMIDEFVNYSTP